MAGERGLSQKRSVSDSSSVTRWGPGRYQVISSVSANSGEPLCERSLSQVVQDSNCVRNALRPGTRCCDGAGRTQAVSSEDEAA